MTQLVPADEAIYPVCAGMFYATIQTTKDSLEIILQFYESQLLPSLRDTIKEDIARLKGSLNDYHKYVNGDIKLFRDLDGRIVEVPNES